MAAIAAVLALSSTQLPAQVAPVPTEPVTVDPATAVPDVTAEPSATSASDPLAAEPTIPTTTPSNSTTTRRAASVTRPVKAAPPVARAPVAARAAAPVVEPAETAAAAPAPLVATPAAPPPATAATPPAQEAPAASNDMLLIAGAAGLGLLGLIGLAMIMRRRKLRRDEEFAEADQYEPVSEASAPADPQFAEPDFEPRPVDPVHAAPVVAAAAPVVGAAPVAASAPLATAASAGPPSACSDAAPGSHVEAACEGPTADNPSLSIKKRLKRAHFFDQRELLVAAGEAAPMAADAGLPDADAEPATPIDERAVDERA